MDAKSVKYIRSEHIALASLAAGLVWLIDIAAHQVIVPSESARTFGLGVALACIGIPLIFFACAGMVQVSERIFPSRIMMAAGFMTGWYLVLSRALQRMM